MNASNQNKDKSKNKKGGEATVDSSMSVVESERSSASAAKDLGVADPTTEKANAVLNKYTNAKDNQNDPNQRS